MPTSRHVLLAALTATLVLLAGCGGESAGTPAPADRTAASSTPDQAPDGGTGDGKGNGNGGRNGGGTDTGEHDGPADDESVPEALDFSATQVSGEPFDARDLAGTATVFWFWAPWCAECAAAAADVQAAAVAAPDVTFVGVAGLSSDVEAMQGFVDDYGLTFAQVADTDGSLYTRFGVTQQDTYVLVSEDGAVETVPAYGDSIDVDALVADTFA